MLYSQAQIGQDARTGETGLDDVKGLSFVLHRVAFAPCWAGCGGVVGPSPSTALDGIYHYNRTGSPPPPGLAPLGQWSVSKSSGSWMGFRLASLYTGTTTRLP